MPRGEDDDNMEDVGRRESQNLLRNKSTAKFLDDVIEKTDADYNEIMEMIEREKRIIDNVDSGFLTSLDLTVHHKAYVRGMDLGRPNGNADAIDDQRVRDVNCLLEYSDSLLEIHRKASHAISDASSGSSDYNEHETARQADQDRVKDILSAGKHVMENDLEAVDQNAKAKQYMNGSAEAVDQANQLFGGRRKQAGEYADSAKALKYIQKGVKKMTKGLESEQ